MTDIFETKTMLKAVKQILPPKTFLLDLFFSRRKTVPTKHVVVDIMKGKRKVAPYVSPKVEGKVMENLGFSSSQYEPAMLKPKKVTDAEEYLNRLPGESPYSPDPTSRAAIKLGEDLGELNDSIVRAEEKMASEALFTGVVTQKGEGVDQVINFGLTNTITLSGNSLWTDYVNSDPMEDIDTWRSLILQKSGMTPDVMIFASDVVNSFLNHPKVQKQLDIRKIEVGKIDPQQLPNGATYLGTLTRFGLDIYSYDEWYYDEDTSSEKPMVPAGTILMGSTKADFELVYGAIADAEIGIIETERFPKTWTTNDPSARFVNVQSKPLTIPKQIDSICVAKVL